jgi:hypothetical protein
MTLAPSDGSNAAVSSAGRYAVLERPMPNGRKPKLTLANELLQLSQEKSPDKRLELLRRVTSVFFEQKGEPAAAEKYLLGEIVTSLLAKIGPAEKIKASVALSKLPEIPEAVAHSLAHDDDIRVALPIIRDYSGIDDTTLIAVANTASQDHLHAIASRSKIRPPVSDAVLDRGNQKVLRALAANAGAEFSLYGMRALADKAEADTGLQNIIVERADVSAGAIAKLLPIVSHELAERLRGKLIEVDDSLIGDHLAGWLRDRERNIAITHNYIDAIRRGTTTLESTTAPLIEKGKLLDVISIFATLADLDLYFAFNILGEGTAQAVLLLLRSLQVPWEITESFLLLRRRKMSRAEPKLANAHEEYEAIPFANAERAVRFMKVRRAAMMQPAGAAAVI